MFVCLLPDNLNEPFLRTFVITMISSGNKAAELIKLVHLVRVINRIVPIFKMPIPIDHF